MSSRTQLLVKSARMMPQPFTLAQLVVKCWQLYPDRFALRGFRFPDSNKVSVTLFGVTGPLARGFFRLVAPGRYEVTAAGIEYAHKVSDGIWDND